MTKPSISLMTCAAVLTFGLCQNAQAEQLSEAVAFALNHHPSVVAAMAGRDVSDEELAEARSSYFPEISLNAATGRVYGDNSTSRGLSVDRGTGYSWNHEGGLTVRQIIFDGLETPNRVEAARARQQAANVTISDTRENLALRVVTAYLDVLRNQESLNMIRDHAAKIADYRNRIGKMVEQGAADESIAVQAHDIQTQLESTLADVQGQLDKSIADYIEASGKAPDTLTRPALEAKLISPDVEEAVKAAIQQHPSLQAAAYQGAASGHDIAAERGTLYPDLNGELSYFKKDLDDVIGGEVVDERALIRMNWNFSTGGAQLARIKQSVHRHAQTVAQAEQLQAEIERLIRGAYAEMNASGKRLEVSRDRVTVSADLVKNYERQFEAAKVTLLNLLQAENAHFNAKLGVLNADYRHLSAQYAVLANTGHLQSALNVQPVSANE